MWKMAFSINESDWETEIFQSWKEKLFFCLYWAYQLGVISWMFFEKLRRLNKIKFTEPLLK